MSEDNDKEKYLRTYQHNLVATSVIESIFDNIKLDSDKMVVLESVVYGVILYLHFNDKNAQIKYLDLLYSGVKERINNKDHINVE